MKYSRKITLCAFTALLGMATAVPSVSYAEAEHISEWVTDENGRIFYYDVNGDLLTGEQEVDGEKYLFSANGVLKTGWRTVDGQRRYYDTKTGKALYGWVDYCGNKYYIDSEKGKTTGFFHDSESNSAYITNEKGSAIAEEGFTELNGSTYYVNGNGNAETGIVEVDGKNYFFSEDDGCMNISDWITTEDGRTCYSNKDGSLLVGWWKIGESTYYFNKDCSLARGVTEIDGEGIYCLDDTTGERKTGWQTINDEQYYFSTSNGKMLVGWWNISDETYYFDQDGVLMKGLVKIGDGTYYLLDDTTGARLTGWQNIDGNGYYFSEEDGKMLFGFQTIGENKFFFNNDGTLARDMFLTDSNGKYYVDNYGVVATGWQTVGDDEYFFDENGIMVTDTTIDGKIIGADGKVQKLSAIQKKGNEIIAQIGTSTEAIFNFVRLNNKYYKIEETRSLAQINSIGWGYFAEYALNNRFIVCYYFAGLTDLLLKQAGWQSRIVYGTGTGAGDHYWNEVYANGTWYAIDTCNGHHMVSFSQLQAYGYTFYQYVYPTY
ncbi:MAG: hypothetical protein K2J08_09475 [Ruminococcus sp.]|nr:hypothetical protein [Ruminococcus sp.]